MVGIGRLAAHAIGRIGAGEQAAIVQAGGGRGFHLASNQRGKTEGQKNAHRQTTFHGLILTLRALNANSRLHSMFASVNFESNPGSAHRFAPGGAGS